MGLDTNRAVTAYRNIKAKREDLKREFTAADAKLAEAQERLRAAMLQHLNETGANSVSTDAGMFYKFEDVVPRGDDWEAFYRWIAEHDTFDFLERRIKKTAVKEYMESHQGAVPPGVSVFRSFDIGVRKGKEG